MPDRVQSSSDSSHRGKEREKTKDRGEKKKTTKKEKKDKKDKTGKKRKTKRADDEDDDDDEADADHNALDSGDDDNDEDDIFGGLEGLDSVFSGSTKGSKEPQKKPASKRAKGAAKKRPAKTKDMEASPLYFWTNMMWLALFLNQHDVAHLGYNMIHEIHGAPTHRLYIYVAGPWAVPVLDRGEWQLCRLQVHWNKLKPKIIPILAIGRYLWNRMMTNGNHMVRWALKKPRSSLAKTQ